ncbi:MAG: hypothetical protein M1816_002342 [Peltula sp. TS41687]|nr:MAG: hypothetical protein M1816_002342 [Peltula sp. TS41687]
MDLPVLLRDALRSRRDKKKWLLALNIDLLRNILLFLFILRWSRKAFLKLKGRGIIGTVLDAYRSARRILYGYFLRAPGIRSQVQKQVLESIVKIESRLVPRGPGVTRYLTLPKEGWTDEQIRAELDRLAQMEHARWEDGFVSGTVYHGGKELLDVQMEAIRRFAVSNPIHPDCFPSVRKMEAEIVAMVLAMFNPPPEAAGLVTSGGTESILMACLSARQKAYTERRVTEPEMILPETAHTAFRKACFYFSIRAHFVACPPPTYKVSISSVSRLINSNTILLVGSAPNFPHGIIDDIPSLSRLALRKNIPLHIDCCLGSFLVPHLSKSGFESHNDETNDLLFDFRNPGVTSISCDTHKYGFAPKGTSILMYRTSQLRSYQYFIHPEWSGGVYASPTMAGSRPGALIAGCWATLMSIGGKGYLSSCQTIVGATRKLESAIREHPSLASTLVILGRPLVSVIAFTTTPTSDIDIYDVHDALSARGWALNALQSPPAIHVAVTLPLVANVDRLVGDLASVLDEEVERRRLDVLEGTTRGKTKAKKGDTAALYGVAARLPNSAVVEELARGFLDTLYKA